MYFNKNMKYLLTSGHMNQNKLANIMGITRQSVNQIMKTKDPRISTVIKVCEIFKLSIDELIYKDLESEHLKENI